VISSRLPAFGSARARCAHSPAQRAAGTVSAVTDADHESSDGVFPIAPAGRDQPVVSRAAGCLIVGVIGGCDGPGPKSRSTRRNSGIPASLHEYQGRFERGRPDRCVRMPAALRVPRPADSAAAHVLSRAARHEAMSLEVFARSPAVSEPRRAVPEVGTIASRSARSRPRADRGARAASRNQSRAWRLRK
jgi:hypothetical protein